jgi:hypothetical protein
MNKDDIIDIITWKHMASVKPSGDQKKIDADIKDFLDNGGEIQKIEEGLCNEDMRLNMTRAENVERQRKNLGRAFNPENKGVRPKK